MKILIFRVTIACLLLCNNLAYSQALPDFNDAVDEPNSDLLPNKDGSADDSTTYDTPLPPLQEDNGSTNQNDDIFADAGNNNQNPSAPTGSGNSGNTTNTQNNNSNGNNTDAIWGGNQYGNNKNQSKKYVSDNDLVNDLSGNIALLSETVDTTLGLNGSKSHLGLGIELANVGLREAGLTPLEQPSTSNIREGAKIAKKNVDFLLQLKDRNVVLPDGSSVPGAELLLNSVVNKTAWPRSTYEPINAEDLDDYEGTCHIAFRDGEIFSSDKGHQFKYFALPATSLIYSLMDLPRVNLEASRSNYCSGTSCSSKNGDGAGIFRCFKNNKSLGLKADTNLEAIVNKLGAGSADQLGFLKDLQLIPQIKAKEASDDFCIDFAGNRIPWAGSSAKFYSSYRHVAALNQGLDAHEFFQHLSSSRNSADSFHNPAKIPIGHAINKHDRYFALTNPDTGAAGNVAIELANSGGGIFGSIISSFLGNSCLTTEEMIKKMESGAQGSKGAMVLSTKEGMTSRIGNQIDMRTSEHQAWSRWTTFKCGGGETFRGTTLMLDKSEALCQKDSKADPAYGSKRRFWDFEVPHMITIIPPMETRIC